MLFLGHQKGSKKGHFRVWGAGGYHQKVKKPPFPGLPVGVFGKMGAFLGSFLAKSTKRVILGVFSRGVPGGNRFWENGNISL